MHISTTSFAGCKNFTRLHDFRDKPEATKCIKCRQRGRQNYFAKKGRGDVISLLPPNAKIGGEGELDHTPLIRPLVQQPRSDYDFYPEEGPALGGPRLTSSRQVALQKNRMSKSRGVPTNPKSRNGGARGDRYANTQYIITDPAMEAMHRPLDHERANSFSSLLGGSYLPGDDGELLLGDDDDIAGNDTGSRSRSDTLLSISSVGLAGLGESLGIISTGKGKTSGRMRRGSEEWDMLASSQYTALLSQDPFDNDLPSAFSLNDVPGQWSQKGKGLRGSSEEESQSTRKRRMSFDAQSGNGNTTTPSNGSSGQEPRGKQISSLFGSGNKNELDSNGNGDSFGAIEEVSVEPELRRSRRDTVELLQSTFGQ